MGELSASAREALESCDAVPVAVEVPRCAPMMRWQFEAWNRIWPVHFHEAAATRSLAVYLEKPPEHELPLMRQFMRDAISIARQAGERGGRPMAALVVRRGALTAASPESEPSRHPHALVAACADTRCGLHVGRSTADDGITAALPPEESPHPLGHAVMHCIEAVARVERAARDARRTRPTLQRRKRRPGAAADVASSSHESGGAGDELRSTEGSEPENGEACIGEGGAGKEALARQQRASIQRVRNALPMQRHVAIDGRDDGDGDGEDTGEGGEGGDGGGDDDGDGDETYAGVVPSTPHLCTDCDVYVTHEPCAMCAMAMVHSRVRRVLYALPAAHGGALGSVYCLHTERSLNHHFQVVSGLLHREATDAGLDAVSGMPA